MSDDATWLLRRIAHDIRGSAAVVSGALAEVTRAPSDEAYFGMADRGLLRLTRLTELLSAAAQARASGLSPTLVKSSLRALVARAHERSLLLHPSRRVRATVLPGPDFELRLDDKLMVSALVEIEINALRFATASVTVSIDSDPGGVEVVVADDGPGFPADHAIHYPWEGKTDGSGLGLAFARDVASAHGGDIALPKQAGRGACVTVRLPAT